MKNPPVVDVHAHAIPPVFKQWADAGESRFGVDFARDEQGAMVYRQGGKWSPLLQGPVYEETATERADRLTIWRVDTAVLSLSPSLHLHGIDEGAGYARAANDSLAEYAAGAPGRFRCQAFLPLQDPPAAAAELERVMGMGFDGAIVSTHVNGTDWDDPGLEPVLATAEEAGAMVFVHPAGVRPGQLLGRYHLRNLIGNPLESTIAIASLIFGGVLDRHPGLKLLFAHGGGYSCWAAGRFDHGQRVRPEAASAGLPSDYLKRLYFDCLTHNETALRHLIDEVGISQVMLGTDDPADMLQEDPVSWLEGLDTVTDTERHAIVAGNYARVMA